MFQHGMSRGSTASQHIAIDIGGALERGEFDLYYQPIIATGSSQVIGCEALLRWNHPQRGRLPAGGFIAIAERTAAIFPLTRFVLGMALRQQRIWRAAGIADLPVWVNLAPPCLRWEGLIDAVTGELDAAGVPPQSLVLEVTENSFVDFNRAKRLIEQLRQLGIGLALDDFGASYSSLGRLRALPMDVVKIDRSFVGDLASDPRDRALVQAMVRLGENLGMTPLAEGVETSEQLDVLHDLGCVWAQGHLFARPMPPPALTAWLLAAQPDRLPAAGTPGRLTDPEPA
jgi:EAL domain-containing protein (putative c-di-GMP-specific phosphodiesterase class I)